MIYSQHPLAKIRSIYPDLFSKGKNIADVILKDPNHIIYKSIKDLAAECGTSESSIVRFCKTIGYSGYNDLKLELAKCSFETDHAESIQNPDNDSSNNSIENLTYELFHNTAAFLNNIVNHLDYSSVESAIRAIHSSDALFINGYVFSGYVAHCFFERMKSLGVPTFMACDPISMKQHAVMAKKKHSFIFISHSGASKDTIETASLAKKSGATIIAITTSPDSLLSDLADILIVLPLLGNSLFQCYFSTETAFSLILSAIYSGFSIVQRDDDFSSEKSKELEYEIIKNAILPYPPNQKN